MPSYKFRVSSVAATFAASSLISVGLVSVAAAQAAPVDQNRKVTPLSISPEALQTIQSQINKHSLAKSAAAPRNSKIQSMVIEMLASPMVLASVDKRVEVMVELSDKAVITAMKSKTGLGQIQGEPGLDNMVRMRVTAAELTNLANTEMVQKISPIIHEADVQRVGSKNSEGDMLLSVKAARDQFGVNGAGKTVCVISDGIEGVAASQASGDLPVGVEVCPQNPGSGAEGTAMLEIIHDLAPGAGLAFCSARGNRLLSAIKWSAQQANGGKGCDVIVDDVGNLTEPRFQISDATQYINEDVKKKGITYVSSAGNDALENYRAYYRDADYSARNADAGFHDFGRAVGEPSNIGFPIIIQPNGRSVVALQWSEPFGKASSDFAIKAALGGGRDIRGTDSPLTVALETDDVQNGEGDPFELLVVDNNTNEEQVYFVLVKRKTGNRFVEIGLLNNANLGSEFAANFSTAEGSITGHAGAAGAISVAAVSTSSPGLIKIQNFSSRGIVKTNFDNAGNTRFNFEFKPDVAATDDVAVTGNGGFPTIFGGTSAAAPHVAAIAALIKNISPNANVASVLKYSADDRGARGPDTVWGFGVVNAQRALQRAPFLGSFGF
jgi:subtilisin family serine protease